MDKYFAMELSAPLVSSALIIWAAIFYSRRSVKRGYHLGIAFSVLTLAAMFTTWLHVGRYSNQLQCEAAYGHLAADPNMCDNPGSGLLVVFFQLPILLGVWLVISTFLLKKFMPKKLN